MNLDVARGESERRLGSSLRTMVLLPPKSGFLPSCLTRSSFEADRDPLVRAAPGGRSPSPSPSSIASINSVSKPGQLNELRARALPPRLRGNYGVVWRWPIRRVMASWSQVRKKRWRVAMVVVDGVGEKARGLELAMRAWCSCRQERKQRTSLRGGNGRCCIVPYCVVKESCIYNRGARQASWLADGHGLDAQLPAVRWGRRVGGRGCFPSASNSRLGHGRWSSHCTAGGAATGTGSHLPDSFHSHATRAARFPRCLPATSSRKRAESFTKGTRYMMVLRKMVRDKVLLLWPHEPIAVRPLWQVGNLFGSTCRLSVNSMCHGAMDEDGGIREGLPFPLSQPSTSPQLSMFFRPCELILHTS